MFSLRLSFMFHLQACITELTTWAKDNLAIIGGLGAGVLFIEVGFLH